MSENNKDKFSAPPEANMKYGNIPSPWHFRSVVQNCTKEPAEP